MTFDEALDAWNGGAGDLANANQEWEFREIVHDALRSGPVETVLEIGSFQGASLRMWRAAFSPSLLIGVEVEETERVRSVLDPAAREMEARVVYGSSQAQETWVEVKGLLEGRPVDFLYVDGDHLYESVKRDFGMYAPLVRPGGLIVLDDALMYWNSYIEVYRLVPELQATHRTKLVSGCGDMRREGATHGQLIVYAP